jgi:sulfur-oxidizing protein SoxZ
MSARALINVPKQAKRGDVIEIKTLISHQMETGFRHGTNGRMIPRDIITTFTAKYEGEEVFSTTFFPAIAANPFVTFYAVADKTGTFTFTWEGDNGFSVTEEAKIVVA